MYLMHWWQKQTALHVVTLRNCSTIQVKFSLYWFVSCTGQFGNDRVMVAYNIEEKSNLYIINMQILTKETAKPDLY